MIWRRCRRITNFEWVVAKQNYWFILLMQWIRSKRSLKVLNERTKRIRSQVPIKRKSKIWKAQTKKRPKLTKPNLRSKKWNPRKTSLYQQASKMKWNEKLNSCLRIKIKTATTGKKTTMISTTSTRRQRERTYSCILFVQNYSMVSLIKITWSIRWELSQKLKR